MLNVATEMVADAGLWREMANSYTLASGTDAPKVRQLSLTAMRISPPDKHRSPWPRSNTRIVHRSTALLGTYDEARWSGVGCVAAGELTNS
ncbi:MAG: hypothetical protein ACFCUR_16390 [Rhodomicrobiaceae bacterium]